MGWIRCAAIGPHITVRKRGGEEWIYPEHGSTCTPGICEAREQFERDECWKKEQEARQEARRKRREEREREARDEAQRAADKAGGNDASDAQGVMLIVSERTHLTLTEYLSGSRSHIGSPDSDPAHPPTTTNGPLMDTPPSVVTTSPIPVIPTEGGFPTFADTDWADRIAAAQSSAGKRSTAAVDAHGTKASFGGEGDEIKVGRKLSQGRGKERGTVWSGARANGAHGASRAARACELDFEVLSGGPGGSCADRDVVR